MHKNSRLTIKNPKSCFFCGEVYGSIRNHQLKCAYNDNNLKSKLGPIKIVQEMINQNESECLFVLVPICENGSDLVQMHYHILKSINPKFVVVTVPFRGTVYMTFYHLTLSEWYTKLKKFKLFLIVINLETTFDYSKIISHIKDVNDFHEETPISGAFCLMFDNWCQVKLNESALHKAALIEANKEHHFDKWEYSQIMIGNEFLGKINEIEKILIASKLINNFNKHLLLGPTYFIPARASLQQQTFDDEKAQRSINPKLLFCPKYKSNYLPLNEDLFCKHCQLKHSFKETLSSCKFCAQMHHYPHLSRHEKNCPYVFAKDKDSSLILLLLSVGELGKDCEIRSNLFGQFMKIVNVVDQNVGFHITRIHIKGLVDLEESILSSKVNILNNNNDTKVVVFVFCNHNDAKVIATKRLVNTNLIPHLSVVNFSIRIQTPDITKSMLSGFDFPPGYNFSLITSNFRFFQMMQIYRNLVLDFQYAIDLMKMFKDCIGIVPNLKILPTFRDWFLKNCSKLPSRCIDLKKFADSFLQCTNQTFPIGSVDKQLSHLYDLLGSFGIIEEENNQITLPENFYHILCDSLPMFDNDVLIAYHSQNKISKLINNSTSLKRKISDVDDDDDVEDDKINDEVMLLFFEHMKQKYDVI